MSNSHLATPQYSASVEPCDIPTKSPPLIDAFNSLLDTEDTDFLLEQYVDPDTAALFSHDLLCLSPKAIDQPISYEEPTFETISTLPSLTQSQDLEKVVVDFRFDDQVSDILCLSYGIENPLETTFQGHFTLGNYTIPSTELDSYSFNTMDFRPKYDIYSRTEFDNHFLHNPDGFSGNNGPSTTNFNDLSPNVLRSIPANDKPSRRSPSVELLASRHWNCLVCGMRFNTYGQLITHASTQIHATLKCHVQPCGYVFAHKGETYRNHLKTAHPDVYECQQCNVSFASQSLLEVHARLSGHACFVCDNQACETTFSRLDIYQRHQNTHRDDAKRFPCPHCDKYSGIQGFKRKDHLTQHLRGYHRIREDDAPSQGGYSCLHEDCLSYRNGSGNGNHSKNHAFNKRSGYINHMRTAHNESEFSCPNPACDRVGGKGYFRRADLRVHMKRVHGTDLAVTGSINA